MYLKKILLISFIVTISGQSCRASLWDLLPGFSQIKSRIQYQIGDSDGARKTENNYYHHTLVVLAQLMSGDNEGKKKAKEEVKKHVGELADAIPGIGHVKGGIHIYTGDKEHGLDSIREATSSTGAVVGASTGGPLGVLAGVIVTDLGITGIDSAVNRQFTPYGVVDLSVNVLNRSSGAIIDKIFAIGFHALLACTGNKPKKQNNTIPINLDRGFDMNSDHQYKQVNEGAFRPEANQVYDINDPAFLETARTRTRLEPDVASRLEAIDFREVNDIGGIFNCYFCTAAAFRNTVASDLVQRYGIMVEPWGAETPDHVVNIFLEIGFPDTRLLYTGDIPGLNTFLNNRIPPGQSASFALAFKKTDGTGHVVLIRVWREENGNGRALTTDFQLPLGHPNRFSTDLPVNIEKIYLIEPLAVTNLTETQIDNFINDTIEGRLSSLLLPSGQKSCANKRIIGYLASWSSRPFTLEQSLHLTNVIYAFIIMNGEGGLTIPTPTSAKQRLLDVMVTKQAHLSKGIDLKVSFSVGGWANSQHFSSVVGDAGKRYKFIAAIATIIRVFKFDGVDIDWEYPIAGEATNGVDSDKVNYVTFLNELRYALGNDYLISIAGAAGQEALEGYDLENIIKVVDWIGVMSYDLNGAWDSELGAFVGPNAPLYHGSPLAYSGKLNANWAMKHYACNTKDPNKIIMGIPFYGRYWSKTIDGIDPSGHPLFRIAEKVNGKYGGDKSYRELAISWLSSTGGFNMQWDDKTKTPWAIHPENNLVLTYDNAKSIKLKVDYAIEHNLGGVMLWSVEQDDELFSLLKTVSANACRQTGNSIKYKCSPIKEKRWWTWIEDNDKAGMCGKGAPLYKGFYPLCDPDDPGYSCCSKEGYCGSGPNFCECEDCVDYKKNPEKLIEEPIKPSRPIQRHVGFDILRSGQSRCGVNAKPSTLE